MKIDILGVHIDNISFYEAQHTITQMVERGGRHYVVTANPEMVVEAQKNRPFQQAINNADLVTPDGTGLRAIAQYLYDTSLNKSNIIIKSYKLIYYLLSILNSQNKFTVIPHVVSGADLFWSLCHWAADANISVILIGGTADELNGTAVVIGQRYPGLQIITDIGAVDIENETSQEFERLKAKISPYTHALLFVAFGHPKQELWIVKHRKELPEGVAMGVGGTFAYVSGRKKRAPSMFRYLGLEWLWRLLIEPKRLTRIFTAVIIFPYTALFYPRK